MQIPLSFGLNKKEYKGRLSPINGAASASVWELSIYEIGRGGLGWYHYGELHLINDKWIFHSHHDKAKPLEPLADFFGEVVMAWYQ